MENQDAWDERLHLVELYFNTTVARSTGRSPYYTVYGQEPRLPIHAAVETQLPSVNAEVMTLKDIWEEVQRDLKAAQED
jgi:hypothetical protein